MSLFTTPSHSKRHIDEENPYWLSFSDIMSGLLIIFILASLYLMIELKDKIDFIDTAVIEMAKSSQVRAEILHEVQSELKKKGVQVDVVDNESVLRIPSDQLHFKQGQFEIPESKTTTVTLIGKYLYQAIVKPERIKYIDTIFIEGHTDSVPARRLPKGNWGLSALRAIVVWDHWRLNPDYGKPLVELRNKKGDPIFSVSGYSSTRRLDKTESDETGLRKNRRIDIRFTMRQPDYQSITNVQKQVQ